MKLLFFLSLLASAKALEWQGKGQLRALQGWPMENRGSDQGCITRQGKWTVNEAQCDLFSGTRKDNFTVTVTTSDGVPCGLDEPGNARFVCQKGMTADRANWMLWYVGRVVFPTETLLGRGQYGQFATVAGYVPQNDSSEPVGIAFYSGSQPTPWIYLGWQEE